MQSRSARTWLTTATLTAATGILLSGCVTDGSQGFGTLHNGACEAFPAPKYQIKGQTSYDQRWADETTETGVSGCGWKRPTARPSTLNPPVVHPKPKVPVAKKAHVPTPKTRPIIVEDKPPVAGPAVPTPKVDTKPLPPVVTPAPAAPAPKTHWYDILNPFRPHTHWYDTPLGR